MNHRMLPVQVVGDRSHQGQPSYAEEHGGPWTWVTLVQSRKGDVLYGVANDPTAEVNVMPRFDRDGD